VRSRRANAQTIYLALREAIVAGELRAGDRLAEEQLARSFAVSRTPVREAILRLEAEHLAERHPSRGLVVRAIPAHETLEVYLVRAVLDGLAARLAAGLALPGDHARLRWLNDRLAEALQQHDLATAAELNMQFHEGLSEAAHNTMLLHVTRQVHDWVRLFGATTLGAPGRAAAALAEHVAILDAIEAAQADLAEQRARQHMLRAHEVRQAMLREAPAAD
jgi:DNA-binding GntR family transcriptional regulator